MAVIVGVFVYVQRRPITKVLVMLEAHLGKNRHVSTVTRSLSIHDNRSASTYVEWNFVTQHVTF